MRLTSIAPTFCVVVALSLAGGAGPAAARGLIGSDRASFMAIVTQHCAEPGAADADLSKLPPAAFRDFCRCTAARVADRTKPAEIEADETPHLRALERAAAKVCYRALRAEVVRERRLPRRPRRTRARVGITYPILRHLRQQARLVGIFV